MIPWKDEGIQAHRVNHDRGLHKSLSPQNIWWKDSQVLCQIYASPYSVTSNLAVVLDPGSCVARQPILS